MAEPVRTRELRTVAGQEVWFDSEGFIWEPDDWTEGLGRGAELVPASLYQAQRALRLGL